MLKKLLLGSLSAVLFSAVVAPAAHASPTDLNLPGGLQNVMDQGGQLTGSTTASFFLSIVGTPLGGDMIVGTDSFSFVANFDTTTNAFQNGSFTLSGLLMDPALTPDPSQINFKGTLTGLSVQNTDQLVFSFNTTAPSPSTAADTFFDSNFGPKGIFQLTLPIAPGPLGGTWDTKLPGTNVFGVSAVDVTAVPTPDAGLAGLVLLGGMAGVRYFRKRSPIC